MELGDALFAVAKKIETSATVEDGWGVIGYLLVRGDRSMKFYSHLRASMEEIQSMERDSRELLRGADVRLPAERDLVFNAGGIGSVAERSSWFRRQGGFQRIGGDDDVAAMSAEAQVLCSVVQKIEATSPEDGWEVIGYALIKGDRSSEFHQHNRGSTEEIKKLARQSTEWLQGLQIPQSVNVLEFYRQRGRDTIIHVAPEAMGRFGTIGRRIGGDEGGQNRLGYGPGILGNLRRIGTSGGQGSGGSADPHAKDPWSFSFANNKGNRKAMKEGRVVFLTLPSSIKAISHLKKRFDEEFGPVEKIWNPYTWEEPDSGVAFLTFVNAASAREMARVGEHNVDFETIKSRLFK